MTPDHDRALLLTRRVPVNDVVLGRAYLIHARHGGIGVALREEGRLGYRLRREKFGHIYLTIEWDWDEGPPHGTAIPLRLLRDPPPDDDNELLQWLAAHEAESSAEIQDNWYEAMFNRQRPKAP